MAVAPELLELLETAHALMEGYEAGNELAKVITKCQQGDYAGAASDLEAFLAEEANRNLSALPEYQGLVTAFWLLKQLVNSEHADAGVQAKATDFSSGEPNYSDPAYPNASYADSAYAAANYSEGTYGEASESSESPT